MLNRNQQRLLIKLTEAIIRNDKVEECKWKRKLAKTGMPADFLIEFTEKIKRELIQKGGKMEEKLSKEQKEVLKQYEEAVANNATVEEVEQIKEELIRLKVPSEEEARAYQRGYEKLKNKK